MKIKTIVFDLDDTLVKEIDYLKSAFLEIAKFLDSENQNLYSDMLKWYHSKKNVFQELNNIYPEVNIETLKNMYRKHYPNFNPNSESRKVLLNIKENNHNIGIITDGYSITQRNKLKALNIDSMLNLVVISEEFGSEKPNTKNYEVFHQFQTEEYYYVGDNTQKDFITPNSLGWKTVCLLDNSENIHKQNFTLPIKNLAQINIKNISELIDIIK